MNAIDAQSIADYLVDLIQQDEELWSDDDEKPTVRSSRQRRCPGNSAFSTCLNATAVHHGICGKLVSNTPGLRA